MHIRCQKGAGIKMHKCLIGFKVRFVSTFKKKIKIKRCSNFTFLLYEFLNLKNILRTYAAPNLAVNKYVLIMILIVDLSNICGAAHCLLVKQQESTDLGEVSGTFFFLDSEKSLI